MVVEVLLSIGYGIVSSIVPLFNSEAYLVAAQVSGLASEVGIALGLAVGQTIGKTLTFMAVRKGSKSPFVKRRQDKLRKTELGPVRTRIKTFLEKLLYLVGTKRWGLPILLLSSCIGIPPLYGVTLIAATTKMPVPWFIATVLIGRTGLFLALAFGVSALWNR